MIEITTPMIACNRTDIGNRAAHLVLEHRPSSDEELWEKLGGMNSPEAPKELRAVHV